MLLRLALEEFVIVESAALEFAPGLNVLTGETGAGKSILLDALQLVAGGRAASETVRAGAERLSVEALFSFLPGETPKWDAEIPSPLDEDGALLVARTVQADGRGRAVLGGKTALVAALRQALEPVLWIVTQGETRALEEGASLESLLDRVAGQEQLAPLYREARGRWRRSHEQAALVRERRAAFARDEEWLRFQAREFDEIDPQPGEHEALTLQLKATRQDSAVQRELALARERLVDADGSVLDQLETLVYRLRSLAEGSRAAWYERLVDATSRLRDLERDLPRGGDEAREEQVRLEERLAALDRLRRKHGGIDEAVFAARASIDARLRAAQSDAARLHELEAEVESFGAECAERGEALSIARRAAAARLSSAAARELADLGMPGAGLAFQFDRAEGPHGIEIDGRGIVPGDGGLDRIGLRFRSHSSQAWGPPHRIASGGELSRVLLALHVSSSQASPGEGRRRGTWVFDEIDAAVGGETAVRMAERLALLARGAQVLLVTHSAAIAARADRHFLVTKDISSGRPRAEVRRLEGDERLAELARMLSGDAGSSIARRHAKELLESARGTTGAPARTERGRA